MAMLIKPDPSAPMYTTRLIGGTHDITIRMPHPHGGGDTIEPIITIPENSGVPPSEEVIARRVCALLNMAAHIDTEDLFIKGATLKLQTFSEAVAPAEMTDREQDLRDTCDSMRRALNRLGKRFAMTSSHPDMIVNNAIECYDKAAAGAQQIADTMNDRTLRLNKYADQLETIEKLLIKHEHHTEGAELWASVDKLIDRVQVLSEEDGLALVNAARALAESRNANKEIAGQLAKADQELATARGDRDEAYRYLKDIQRVLAMTPEEIDALFKR